MNLCAYSKSEVLAHDILAVCPLKLNTTEAKHCPCRRRRYHVPPADLRVLSCEFPQAWNGDPLTNPSAVKSNIQRRIQKQKTTTTTTKEL